MQIAKIRSYVGFAIKARKAKIGVDNIVSAKHPSKIVLFDSKLSQNSLEKLQKACDNNDMFCIAMDQVVPGRTCLAIGITESNLAKAIRKEMEENS